MINAKSEKVFFFLSLSLTLCLSLSFRLIGIQL